MLRPPERDRQAAGGDQGTADDDRQGRPQIKSEPIDQLRQQKEQRYIDSEEPPEIPWRCVDRQAVGGERQPAKREKSDASRRRLAVEAKADQRIATGFEHGGNEENGKESRVGHGMYLGRFGVASMVRRRKLGITI